LLEGFVACKNTLNGVIAQMAGQMNDEFAKFTKGDLKVINLFPITLKNEP